MFGPSTFLLLLLISTARAFPARGFVRNRALKFDDGRRFFDNSSLSKIVAWCSDHSSVARRHRRSRRSEFARFYKPAALSSFGRSGFALMCRLESDSLGDPLGGAGGESEEIVGAGSETPKLDALRGE